MKKSAFLPLITIIVAAILLLTLNLSFKNTEEKNAKTEFDRALKTLLPGSTSFEKEVPDNDSDSIRAAYKGETGYVIETVTHGYADDIIVLVGVSNDGKVTGLVVREMHETPGLGGNALWDYKFLAQFLNTDGNAKEGVDIDALSGATVTTKAITRCVNAAVGYVTGTDTDSGATVWEG